MYQMETLKKLRKQSNYTIYQMAKILKITPSFYSQIENKKKRLFYDMAVKISDIFDKKPDEIFYPKQK